MIRTGNTQQLYYTFTDNLGSVLELIQPSGVIAESYSFDAWGRRRNPANWSYTNITNPTILTRGFTGHEHLDEFDLINMNARLYDPYIARMLGPDKYVVDPYNAQHYNRYSYVWNNPLKWIDPTGNAGGPKDRDPITVVHKKDVIEVTKQSADVVIVGEKIVKPIELSYSAYYTWLQGGIVGGQGVAGMGGFGKGGGGAQGSGGSGTWDPVTNQRISQLDPRLQRPATDFINAAQAQGVNLRITQGFRSIAEQDALYNQGRTTPGSIVTNARGGQSYHNYGLAFDVVMMQNGQPVWDRIPANIGALGATYGFEWGGGWRTFPDYPHFQMTFGQSILDLQRH
jgi:RHS repeat-associated protein